MLFRANLYFDAWWLSAGVEGRRQFKTFLEEYWEFWRFNEHAMQFAFVVYIAGLYEKRSNTVNFQALWKQVKPIADQRQQDQYDQVWSSVQSVSKSVAILRSNAMAHRSMTMSYAEAFRKASVTPDQLRKLLSHSWELLNIVEDCLGLEHSEYDPVPIEILRELAQTGD